MPKELKFKPKARILLQLGDQLIKNESIALLELVKNSYDADASYANIFMKNPEFPEKGEIIIEDDESGMDLNTIETIWMEPGNDYKQKLFDKKERTPKYHRLPLGEKGIGRFGAHKLGNLIELITRKKDNPEIFLSFDWEKKFGVPDYLDDVTISIFERDPEIFTGENTGTKIIIKKFRTPWNRGKVREVSRAITSICSPFDSPDSFKPKFNVDKEDWLKGLLTIKNFKENALFRFNVEIEGNYIKKFNYNFTPLKAMKKLEPHTVKEDDEHISKLLRMVDKSQEPIDLGKYQIGTIKFEGYIFDRQPKILALGVQDKKGLKEFLDNNGGIRVYRDGIRVYDYGEEGNDWLSLDIRRVNIPTKRVSNNLIISAIELDREKSSDLIEKTNREGFIENDAYFTFAQSILYVLSLVETLRGIDKEKLRTFYGSNPKSEPVISNLEELNKIVDEQIKEESVREEIKVYLKRINDDYNFISETLLRSAGAGLSLSIVIHEIDKIISELNEVIKTEKPSNKITTLIKHLADLIEGYSLIIKKSDKKKQNLKNLIEQAIFNIEFRLESHKIEISRDYKNFNEDSDCKVARNLIIGSILNILDNSIWWLEYGNIKNKKIYISLSNDLPGYLSIIIADNGPGFGLPTEEITKPFVSGKPDGMGLGLHIAKEIMEVHGGLLIFPDLGDFSVPDEFKNGAIVALAFKNEGNT